MRRRVKVQVWVGAAKKPLTQVFWKTMVLTSGLLVSALGLVMGGSWLAVRLIVNPGSLSWLSQVLPDWSDHATTQTLDEISAEVADAGRWIDKPLYFSPDGISQRAALQQMLLPVLRPRKHCSRQAESRTGSSQTGSVRPCGEVVELRIYRPKFAADSVKRAVKGAAKGAAKETTYELIDRIGVTGPEELSAIAPLTQAAITQGTTRILPLTTLQVIDGKAPTADLWFHLSGEWKRGTRVLYGQVIRYDPQRNQLNLMQSWNSPAGQLPYWQQVTGSDAAELVVNQSIGLEPQFQIYQLKPAQSVAQPIRLEAIVLTEAALSDRAYIDGLLLARNGLWSPALSLLQTVKRKGTWSTAAQSQLDLIGLHAKVTQTQADRDWASPTQQILAQLIDGRWSKGLSALKSAHTSGYDVRHLLSANVERLWQRVEMALRVNARQADLQQWGVLILAVKQNREQALVWLKKQPRLPVSFTEQTLALLEPTAPLAVVPIPTIDTPVPATAHPASLIGTVITPITPVPPHGSDWTLAETSLSLPTGQTWYQINVIEFYDGQSWQQLPFSNLETAIAQKLSNTSLQIVVWQGATQAQTLTATVKAVRFNKGQLLLLATAASFSTATPATLVAITPGTVHWVQPLATTTFNHLAQQPVWNAALDRLWQDLQTAQLVSAAAPSTAVTQTIGNWSIQMMELTGDQTPEVVLTIEAADRGQPRTVIFSEQGNVMYSDLNAEAQSIVAMIDRTLDSMPTLMVTSQQGLELQQWSIQNQRFE